MKTLLTIFILLLCSCTTVEFVRKDTNPKKQAVLRHYPASSPEKGAEYREEVRKQARGFCGGEYDVVREYQAREDSGSSGVSTGVGVGMGGSIFIGGSSRNTQMYNFIEISCRQP